MSEHTALPDSLCDLYDVLSAARRCHTIRLLARTDETPVSARFLARNIAAIEQNVRLEQATGEPYRNVYTALLQTHLPALADVDIVDYDGDRKVVRRGERFQPAVLLLTINRVTYRTLRQTRAWSEPNPQ